VSVRKAEKPISIPTKLEVKKEEKRSARKLVEEKKSKK
jgi:hypothetical protein